eukprot:COSAG05_NODE_10509_length_561_cov_2.770563_2_plen_94_part_00
MITGNGIALAREQLVGEMLNGTSLEPVFDESDDPRHGIQRILLLLYGPRRPRTMHVEFLVKNPAEIYSMHDLIPRDFVHLRFKVPCVSIAIQK